MASWLIVNEHPEKKDRWVKLDLVVWALCLSDFSGGFHFLSNVRNDFPCNCMQINIFGFLLQEYLDRDDNC
eukprot:c35716_g1_i1 orf=109-321(-)